MTEQLTKWKGRFGKEYTKRNTLSLSELNKLYKKTYNLTLTQLNKIFLGDIDTSSRILEVGCNTGNQLLCLQKMGFKNLYGIEPQEYAINILHSRIKGVNVIEGNIFDIPFKDKYFDLVFTEGVLIHISPCDIKKAIKEIYRCSKKYIGGFEYYSEKYEEVKYWNKKNLLWKANFSKIYTDTFPDLKVVKKKFIKYLQGHNIDIMFLLKKNG